MTKKPVVLAIANALLVLGLALPLHAQSIMNAQDQDFANKLAQGNLGEASLGQVASTHAGRAEVKQFGERMNTDHTTSYNELKNVATTLNMTIASTVSAQDVSREQQLSAMSGDAFDRAYIQQMVADHEATATELRKEIDQGQNAELKGYATRTLPVVLQHLELARQIASQLGANP